MTDILRRDRILCCGVIIAAGLILRGFGLHVGLPSLIVKYGGSVLWGTMVFMLVAIAMGRRRRIAIALAAAVIAASVELFRLYHAPWIDAFRLTLAGALLLGRIFSPYDFVAYAAGIAFGVAMDIILQRRLLFTASLLSRRSSDGPLRRS